MTYFIIVPIRLEGKQNLWKEWDLFRCDDSFLPEMRAEIYHTEIGKYNLEMFPSKTEYPVLKSGDYILCVNEKWNNARIVLTGKENLQDFSGLMNALLMSFLSRKETLLVHSSLVDVAGKGIMFLGPSGIGKTTQAELWMKYRGADIINGDMVYVKRESDCFLGCGSPWHGSSSYCLNRQVPLSGMVVLKQSSENSIRRLTDMEMITAVMNSVFFPSWYREGYEAACDTLDVLLQTVPVYELSCRPDEDAVRLTEETVLKDIQ